MSDPQDESGRNADAEGVKADAPLGIDPKLLEILVCPLTKATLEYDAGKQELISKQARLAYPIRDGIPIMLPEEARQLPD
ncbi:MAG: Trm112 family protein [Salinarimonas sp.]|nr:Trm112 family protein [Salinarimonas sp.]